MRPLKIDEEMLARFMPKNRLWALTAGHNPSAAATMQIPDDFYIPTSEDGIWLKISISLSGSPPDEQCYKR